MLKNKTDVESIKQYITTKGQNQFDLDQVLEGLVNITTGKIASQEVQESLGNIPEKGRSAVETFVNKRLGDEHIKRFLDSLGRIIVLTFSDMKKGLANDKDKKLILDAEVLFRRLHAVSRSRKIDLKMLLTYELAGVPPSLYTMAPRGKLPRLIYKKT